MIAALIPAVSGILDKFVEDKDQKAKLAHELATMADTHAQERAMAAAAINKEDSKGNWFQSSWRPLAGYTAVLGLAVNYLVAPIAGGFGLTIPQADMGVMLPLLAGLLGMGSLRTYERKIGKDK